MDKQLVHDASDTYLVDRTATIVHVPVREQSVNLSILLHQIRFTTCEDETEHT